MSLKISKLDIHLPMELVRACANMTEAQLCKFVATNTEGEFQHSIEIRHKQEKGISLEFSNLEIGYEEGRFVAEIMQVFKVFQGSQEGADQVAVVVPTNAQETPKSKKHSSGAATKDNHSSLKRKTATSSETSSVSDTDDSRRQCDSDTGSISYKNTNNRLSHFNQKKQPRQLFSQGGKGGGSEGAINSPVKRLKAGEDSDSGAEEKNIDNTSKDQFQPKEEIIEIKEEPLELSEIQDSPFMLPNLPPAISDSMSNQPSSVSLTDMYSSPPDPTLIQSFNSTFPPSQVPWPSPGGLQVSNTGSQDESSASPRSKQGQHLQMSPDLLNYKFGHFRIHRCMICGKQFRERHHLKGHIQTHMAKSQRPSVTCPYPGCGRTYLRRETMRRHYREMHTDGQQPI